MSGKQLEKNLENKIKKFLKEQNHWFIKTHGGFFTKSGVPDILACIDGKFVAFEIKREDQKGKVSELQLYNKAQIISNGGYAFITDDYKEFLEQYKKVRNVI